MKKMQSVPQRRLAIEILEGRVVLSGIPAPVEWPAPSPRCHEHLDTNVDGRLTPVDALLVINLLNTEGVGPDEPWRHPSSWPDANLDGLNTPVDALLVINALNTYGSGRDDPLRCVPINVIATQGAHVPSQAILVDPYKVTDLFEVTVDVSRPGAELKHVIFDVIGGEGIDQLRLRNVETGQIFASASQAEAEYYGLGGEGSFATVLPEGYYPLDETLTFEVQLRTDRADEDAEHGLQVAVSLTEVGLHTGVGVETDVVVTGPPVTVHHTLVHAEVVDAYPTHPDPDGVGVPTGTDVLLSRVTFESVVAPDDDGVAHSRLRDLVYEVTLDNVELNLDANEWWVHPTENVSQPLATASNVMVVDENTIHVVFAQIEKWRLREELFSLDLRGTIDNDRVNGGQSSLAADLIFAGWDAVEDLSDPFVDPTVISFDGIDSGPLPVEGPRYESA